MTALNGGGDRVAEIWDYIAVFLDDKGFPPTIREIGLGVGLTSPGTIHAYLRLMEGAGNIERVAGSPRAIRLISRP